MANAAQVLLLLTIHSVLLTGCALLVARHLRSPGLKSVLLRIAVLSAFGTVSAQVFLGVGVRLEPAPYASGPRGVDLRTVSAGQEEMPYSGAAQVEKAAPAGLPEAVSAATGAAALPFGQWLLCGWLAVAGTMVFLQERSRRRFLGRLGRTPLEDDDARAAAQLPRAVSLTASSSLDAPVVLSSREICLPAEEWWQMDLRERAAALAHELAHIERRDPLFRRVASILAGLLFHQPLLRAALIAESSAAELDCDAISAERTGDPIAMAGALARAAASLRLRPVPCGLPAMASRESDLVTRVRALTAGPAPRSSMAQRRAVAGASLAALAAFACVSPRWVDTQAPAPEASVVLRVGSGGEVKLYAPGSSEVRATSSLVSVLGRGALNASLADLKADLSLQRSEVGNALGESLRVLEAVDTPIVIELAGQSPWRYVQLAMESAASAEAQFWNVVIRDSDTGQEHPLPLSVDIGVLEHVDEARALTVRLDTQAGGGGIRYTTKLVTSDASGLLEEVEEGAPEAPNERRGPFTSLGDLLPVLEASGAASEAYFLTIDARSGITLSDVSALLDAVAGLSSEPRRVDVMGSFER